VTTSSGELTAADVDSYTSGRLAASDPETTRMLAATLSAVRRDVGWHVSPVYTADVLTMNGPPRAGYDWGYGYGGGYGGWGFGWGGMSSHKLRVPTQKIVDLDSIIENGVTLDLTKIVISAQDNWNRNCEILIRHFGHWTHRAAGIVITMDHGYTPDEAADWRQAILALVDQMSEIAIMGHPGSELLTKTVDDAVYKWNPTPLLPSVSTILDKYRLIRSLGA
jgi:hypothetical protein